MTEDSDKKGFSGLSSLVSDVDEPAPRTRRKQEETKAGGASTKASETTGTRPAAPPRIKPAPKPRSEPGAVASGSSQNASTLSSGAKWFGGLVIIGGLIWLFVPAQEDGEKSTGVRSYPLSTLSPSYTPSSTAPTLWPAHPRTGLTFEIQTELIVLGYDPGRADGIYGPQTKAAIEAFQRSSGFPAVGQANQQLLGRLRKAAASR